MRAYPSYRLEDFHRKRYLDGGVTSNQLFYLFRTADEEKYEYYRFLGQLQGVDIADPDGKNAEPDKQVHRSDGDRPLFQDPVVYESWSEEEREAETKVMMNEWSDFGLKTSPKR